MIPMLLYYLLFVGDCFKLYLERKIRFGIKFWFEIRLVREVCFIYLVASGSVVGRCCWEVLLAIFNASFWEILGTSN